MGLGVDEATVLDEATVRGGTVADIRIDLGDKRLVLREGHRCRVEENEVQLDVERGKTGCGSAHLPVPDVFGDEVGALRKAAHGE